MYVSPYGKVEGLRERIQKHLEILGRDKSIPWVGMGLLADLELVAKVLPDNIEQPADAPMNLEYDL